MCHGRRVHLREREREREREGERDTYLRPMKGCTMEGESIGGLLILL
jgi:hypothetical protein